MKLLCLSRWDEILQDPFGHHNDISWLKIAMKSLVTSESFYIWYAISIDRNMSAAFTTEDIRDYHNHLNSIRHKVTITTAFVIFISLLNFVWLVMHAPYFILKTNPEIISLWGCDHNWDYRKTSYIIRTLVGNKNVDNSDVVGASPVGAAPTTSSFST